MGDKLKIGLVISADILRVLSFLPLLDFLRKERIEIDLMVGVAGGAVLSALWRCGFDMEECLHFFKGLIQETKKASLDFHTLWQIASPPTPYVPNHALLKADKIQKRFADLFKEKKLEDLHPKTVFQATDAFSGETVMVERGLLSEAVYASQALFPLYPPIQLNGNWLVSGAYSVPLPILQAVNRNMDFVIGARADSPLTQDSNYFIDNAKEFMSSAFTASHFHQNVLAVSLHHYEISFIHISLNWKIKHLDVEAIPAIVAEGRRILEARKDQLLENISNFQRN